LENGRNDEKGDFRLQSRSQIADVRMQISECKILEGRFQIAGCRSTISQCRSEDWLLIFTCAGNVQSEGCDRRLEQRNLKLLGLLLI
jgi:hypothetical protein